MDKYFAGTLPFSSEKVRTDIPDALIVEAIFDLTSQGPIFDLAQDGRVSEALRTNPGIKVFTAVKALLDSDDFQDALGDIDEIDVEHEQANVAKTVMEFRPGQFGISQVPRRGCLSPGCRKDPRLSQSALR